MGGMIASLLFCFSFSSLSLSRPRPLRCCQSRIVWNSHNGVQFNCLDIISLAFSVEMKAFSFALSSFPLPSVSCCLSLYACLPEHPRHAWSLSTVFHVVRHNNLPFPCSETSVTPCLLINELPANGNGN